MFGESSGLRFVEGRKKIGLDAPFLDLDEVEEDMYGISSTD